MPRRVSPASSLNEAETRADDAHEVRNDEVLDGPSRSARDGLREQVRGPVHVLDEGTTAAKDGVGLHDLRELDESLVSSLRVSLLD